MDAILYHNACPDGWCAAFIAKQKYPEASLIPLDHGKDPGFIDNLIESLRDKDVIMVDFSFRTREENDKLNSVAKSFRILDHHKTAQANLEGASYATFDMNRSGAGLAWDYLFGKDATDLTYPDGSNFQDERPWWVNYVEARDLWRWDSVPNAREACAFLGTLPFTIEAWKELDKKDLVEARIYGQGALAHIDHYVRETIKNARPGVFADRNVLILNTTYLNCSEIGNELSKNAAFSVTWFERNDDIIQFSLRSIGDFDVGAVAKTFNGGGHKNAAGFQLSLRDGRDLIDRILGREVVPRWVEFEPAVLKYDGKVVGPRHG